MYTFLTATADAGARSYTSIFVALLIFGFLVLIHELGHFLFAKRAGILVSEFAIGMGPKVLSRKIGETVYSLRLFPIGGFCAMQGEDEADFDERSFNSKSVWDRGLVIVAGSLFNLIFAFICSFYIISSYGYGTTEIRDFVDGYNLSETGIEKGDIIVKMDNTSIRIYEDIMLFLYGHEGEPIDVTIVRDGIERVYVVTPKNNGDGYRMGFTTGQRLGMLQNLHMEGYRKATLSETVSTSISTMRYYIKSTVIGFVRVVSFNVNKNDVSGFIGIVDIIGETYDENIKDSPPSVTFANLLYIAGVLSANLGALNLLPIPAMDGGRLVFIVLEGIRGKRIPPDKEGYVHTIGFMCLIGLMIYITFNDLVKIFG